ncbi:hypothetical protein LEP1GSC170_2998 [Leptospira interrogans serovar Bataviae str. HAI135]|nr:hypothetical protein LEP1GSC170_2998 [Leptospira interrogans serovar Bataviae str. HAI135]
MDLFELFVNGVRKTSFQHKKSVLSFWFRTLYSTNLMEVYYSDV